MLRKQPMGTINVFSYALQQALFAVYLAVAVDVDGNAAMLAPAIQQTKIEGVEFEGAAADGASQRHYPGYGGREGVSCHGPCHLVTAD